MNTWLDYMAAAERREAEPISGSGDATRIVPSARRPDPSLPEDSWRGVYPGMCADPEICRGYTHCPRSYSCCE